MAWVILNPTELFVVLNQGRDYLEGYLAKKPRDLFEQLERDLEEIHGTLKHPTVIVKDLFVVVPWDRRLTRGIVLSAAGRFVDVFLLDYGIRECCSKSILYVLPEEYQRIPSYGIRIELEAPPPDNLRDREVLLSSLRRFNAILAKGLIAGPTEDAKMKNLTNGFPGVNGAVHTEPNAGDMEEPHGQHYQNGVRESNGIASRKEFPDLAHAEPLTNGVNPMGNFRPQISTSNIIKPPNDMLLEMIGTRCLLTRILVQEVTSPIELLCSHYPSLMVVRNALDSMTELPVRVAHDKVRPNMLVLVLSKATLHRGIVGAIFNDREDVYRVEFIDLPGSIESSLLYHTPSSIAHCAPRALMKVRLKNPLQNVSPGEIATLLCESTTDNTVYGVLVGRDYQAPLGRSAISKPRSFSPLHAG